MKSSHLLCIAMLCMPLCSQSQTAQDISGKPTDTKPLQVTFVSPSPPSAGFWEHYEQALKAAAKQLDIGLHIIHAKDIDRYSHFNAVQQALSHQKKPEYLITLFRRATSDKMLREIETSSVKFFATNTDIPDDFNQFIGTPRARFKHWLGHIRPDDFSAGEVLMQELGSTVSPSVKNDTPLGVVALTGSRDSTAVFLRNAGLKSQIEQFDGRFKLEQLLFTDWRYDTVAGMVPSLLERYPNTRVVWCANDEIAAAVADAMKRMNLKNKPLIGGIDWSKDGIERFQRDEFATTVGGHFIEGGIILAMLYDYHHGMDFQDNQGNQILMSMGTLSRSNVKTIQRMVLHNDFSLLDFKRLSRFYSGDQQVWSSNYVDIIDKITLENQLPMGD